jgi:hypothetical protein
LPIALSEASTRFAYTSGASFTNIGGKVPACANDLGRLGSFQTCHALTAILGTSGCWRQKDP